MFANPRLAFLLVAVLFLGSHMAQANASSEEDEGNSGTDTILQPNSLEEFTGDGSGPDIIESVRRPIKLDATEL